MTENARYVIIGAGIHGLSTAWSLARRLRATGKPPKAALVACAHKLLTILNAMLRDGRPWDPATVRA